MATKDNKDEKSEKKVVAAKRVFDVAKPGDSAPDTTSRPVIVGHKPVMQDPMVNQTTEEPASPDVTKAEVPSETSVAPPSHTAKVIAPLTQAEKGIEAKSEDKTDESTADKATETASSTEDKPAEDKSPDSEETTSDDSTDAAVVDAVVEQANTKNKKEDEAAAARAKELEAIIESKKYFVPIRVASKKRTTRALIIFVSFIVLFVGLLAAADAGLINLGFKLPFDIIK